MNREKLKSKLTTAASKASQLKQAAYERVGRSENSLEPEVLRASGRATEQLSTCTGSLAKALDRSAKSLVASVPDFVALSDASIGLAAAGIDAGRGSASADRKGGEAALLLGELLLGWADGLDNLASAQRSSATVLRDTVVADANRALAQKAVYDKARLTAESARDRAAAARRADAPGAKIMAADAEADEAMSRLTAEQLETQQALAEASGRGDATLALQVAEQFDAYREFFQAGLSWLVTVAPAVEELRESALESQKAGYKFDGPGGKLFGAPFPEDEPPAPILALCAHVAAVGLEEEGIFRVTGFKSRMEKVRAEIESSGTFEAPAVSEGGGGTFAHEAASLLKQYLRELPVPLLALGGADADEWIEAGSAPNEILMREALLPLLRDLPPSAMTLFTTLVELCLQVLEHSEQNRMTAETLAIVIAPSLLPMPDMGTNPKQMVAAMDAGNTLLSWLFLNWNELSNDDGTLAADDGGGSRVMSVMMAPATRGAVVRKTTVQAAAAVPKATPTPPAAAPKPAPPVPAPAVDSRADSAPAATSRPAPVEPPPPGARTRAPSEPNKGPGRGPGRPAVPPRQSVRGGRGRGPPIPPGRSAGPHPPGRSAGPPPPRVPPRESGAPPTVPPRVGASPPAAASSPSPDDDPFSVDVFVDDILNRVG